MGLVKEVFPFPPGCWYEDGVFHRYRDPAAADVVCPDKGEDLLRGIRERLIEGVDKRLDSDAPLGFLLSGGLDSSLVCAIAARKLNKPIRTFAVGMEKDAIDLKYARQVADYTRRRAYGILYDAGNGQGSAAGGHFPSRHV